MKKFQKLLAILLTAVMCVGTLADTGFTVFAADDAEDAVSEAQAEEGQEDAAVEAADAASDAATVEEDDPADDEPALDGGTTVNVLTVNGIDLKGKEGKALNADGSDFTGNVNDADAKYMRFDNDKETRLTLQNIKLNGDCQHGIEFKGDALYVDVIGNCEIKVTGKNNSVSYGVYTYDWGNVTFRSTLDAEGKRVKGKLEIKPVTNPNAKWGGSIYCKGGNLAFETRTSASDTKIDWMDNNERGLEVVADAGEAERSSTGGEIEGKYDVKVTDAYVQVYASGLNGYYSGIECSQKLSIYSGLVITYVDAFETGSESVAVAIRAGGDIYIGEDAYVIADGEMLDTTREGRGISTPGGKITVKGKLDAASSGGDLPIYAGGNVEQTIILDGTAVNIPEEGIYDKTKKTITAYNGNAVDRVIIEKGQYYDVWVAGYRLATWNHDYLMGVDGIGEKAGFDPETGTLTFKNVNGISYRTGAAPSAPSDKSLIYTKIPLTISGNARINYSKNIIYSQFVDLNIQGQFDFTSDEEAVLVGEAKLTIDGADTSLKVESKKEEAICCGSEGSSMVINNGVIDAKGAKAGIYCDGNIEINGGEVTAKATADSEAYAFMGFGNNRKINIKEGLDIVIPEGGKVKVVKNSYNKNVTTVVDGNDNVAKEVKIAEKKYDLWLGNTQVTSTNKGDILGDGKASFDPDTWTLTLNGELSIPGGNKFSASKYCLIYSKHALNVEGSASFDTEYTAIAIEAGNPVAESRINGDFDFRTAGEGIYSDSLINIEGSGNTVTMDTAEECVNGYVVSIIDATVSLNSKNSTAIVGEAALGLAGCDLTAKGKSAAVSVLDKGENAIVLKDGVEIIEPEGAKIAVEGATTTIKDSDGKTAEAIHIGIPATVVTVTVEAVDRVYESGKLDVELTNAELKGVESGDDVELDLSGATALMDDDKAGENKAVKISGIKLTGKDASKYKLKQPVGVTVNIKKAEWTLTKLSLVLEQEKIGTQINYPIAPIYRPSGAYIEGVQAANGADQLDGDATVKSPTEISFKIKSGTELNDVDARLLITMTGADNYEDYILELSVVGKHEHTEDILELVEAVDAKCETPGVKEHYECKRCFRLFEKAGDTFKEVHESDLIVPALGHYLDDDIYDVLVYPTETTDGKARFHCQRSGCDYFEDKVLPKGTEVHRPSALNPVPENLDSAYTLTLVKGQKFNMPGSGWKSVDKNDKKYVSVSKKGAVKAKKATPEGVVSKITNGSRTIEIKVIQPKFEKKTINMEAKGVSEPKSCGFVVGDELVSVAYYSSSPDVVTVSDKGMLEAKTYGTATITAYVNGKAYTAKVKVTEPEPLKERTIHANLNVKKNITIKGVKIKEWTVADYAKEHVLIKKTQVTGKMAGEFTLNGTDKDGNVYKVTLIVDDPELKEPAFAPDKHKAGTYKYKLETEAGTVAFLKYVSMNQSLCFKSSNGSVAYVDEKLRLIAQNKGKCKLTAKINGKTVTINVKVN